MLEGHAGGRAFTRPEPGAAPGIGPHGLDERVPYSPEGPVLALPGLPGPGAPLTSTALPGAAGRGKAAGLWRGKRSAVQTAAPGLQVATPGRKCCQPCPSHAARRRVALSELLCSEVQGGPLSRARPPLRSVSWRMDPFCSLDARGTKEIGRAHV